MNIPTSFRVALVGFAVLVQLAAVDSRAQEFPLELMVEDVESFADGETFPGAEVVFGAATATPFPIGGGTVELIYDPAFTDGSQPVVKIDPRYGAAVIDSVTEPVPGQLIVVFSSPDGTLNATFPGMFLTASVPSLDTIIPPTTFPFALGPTTTLMDPDGVPIAPLEAEADPTEFLVPEILFADGLDGGDLLEWWDVVL